MERCINQPYLDDGCLTVTTRGVMQYRYFSKNEIVVEIENLL